MRERRMTTARRVRRNGAVGGRWTPLKFGSGLITWWRESGIQASGSNLTGWNADAASATVRNLSDPEPDADVPDVVTNGGENAVQFSRSPTLGQFVRLTGTSYDALTAATVWVVWKHGTTLNTTQALFSLGYASSGSQGFDVRLISQSSQLYPAYFVQYGTNVSCTEKLANATEEATNPSWRQVPASTVCAFAVEIDSTNDTVRMFYANSSTMREFSLTDNNDGLLIFESLGSSGGARGDCMSAMTLRNRIAIGCSIVNNDTNDTNFLDGTVFEVGVKSGTLGDFETNFLAYLMARRAKKS